MTLNSIEVSVFCATGDRPVLTSAEHVFQVHRAEPCPRIWHSLELKVFFNTTVLLTSAQTIAYK